MARKNNSELLFSVPPFIIQIEKSDSELSIVKIEGWTILSHFARVKTDGGKQWGSFAMPPPFSSLPSNSDEPSLCKLSINSHNQAMREEIAILLTCQIFQSSKHISQLNWC